MSDDLKAETLAPCPFCGGEASVGTFETESLWSHAIVTYTSVGCSECDIQFSTEPGYELEAPEAWNRRALQHSPHAGGVEAVDLALVIGGIKAAMSATDPLVRDAFLQAALDFAENDPETLAEGQAWVDPPLDGPQFRKAATPPAHPEPVAWEIVNKMADSYSLSYEAPSEPFEWCEARALVYAHPAPADRDGGEG